MNINNHSINDPDTTANSFNSFFASVAQNFLHEQPSNYFTQDPIRNLNSNVLKLTTSLHFSPTSTDKIKKIIQALKTKDSHGYDEISSRILKLSTRCILSPLTYICNTALCLGIFPDSYQPSNLFTRKGTQKALKITDPFQY